MSDLYRVFFHELGHFVAHELNRLHYNGTGTKSITIYSVGHNDPRFLGDAKINLSEDERERYCPTKEILPEYLASSSYGCMFQAYYLKGSLDECFKLNGGDDEQKWYGALRDNRLDDYRSEITASEKEFFNKLIKEKLLDKFMSIDPDQYLTKIDSTNYVVNMGLLREDTKSIIDEHVPAYSEMVQKNKDIIDKYSSL